MIDFHNLGDALQAYASALDERDLQVRKVMALEARITELGGGALIERDGEPRLLDSGEENDDESEVMPFTLRGIEIQHGTKIPADVLEFVDSEGDTWYRQSGSNRWGLSPRSEGAIHENSIAEYCYPLKVTRVR